VAAVLKKLIALAGVAALLLLGGIVVNGTVSAVSGTSSDPGQANADELFLQGRQVFRFETFGDEAVWGGVLGLHNAIEGSALGGVGPGISPKQALALGLKVDATAIPADLAAAIKAGNVNLDDPAVTVQLPKLNAVVGLRGFFDADQLTSVGISCAVCHSTVDDWFASGIGNRLDGRPNQDLNVGAIVASAPNLQPLADALHTDVATVKTVLHSWVQALFTRSKRGFYHDGRFPTLLDVVDHYNSCFNLGLTRQQETDLVAKRVLDERADDPRDVPAVTENDDLSASTQLQPLPLRLRGCRQLSHDRTGDPAERNWLGRERHPARIEPRQVEQIEREPDQPLELLARRSDELALRRAIELKCSDLH
jgi:hypothetical protein